MAYTKFIASLSCWQCGQTNRAYVLSDLDDSGESYEVGDRVDARITVADFDAAYATVRRPLDGEPIHAVGSFSCANCSAANFAEIVFADGVLASIDQIDLDPIALERTHYLGSETTTEEMLERIAAEPLRVGSKLVPNWLALVRAGLAAGRRW